MSRSEKFQLNQANNLSFGYTKKHYWLRYTLENPHKKSRSLIVQVDYPLIDTIDFYQPGSDGSFKQLRSGDSQPLENRYLRHHSFTFHLDIPPNSQKTYYMRVGSTSTVTIPLRLWDDTKFVNHMNISSKAQ
ncbi:7TMR-DISM extracellular 2 [Pseudobacteriovorax antillogorgiicola]|uniref:7TMR-DISM extracellular 2 n=1 Tax=Pseudobacteriovorax antillogorgiicola TaxID=1513793 RepID=A0A1Y6CKZ4_9BACT|nr:7TMR-DISM extracellular protein 2 [Pseudobacteriovorax antillogorgiicola]SMF61957.1 7TMR-DISM extracellular 2 [Pseudobacteriovorax antillogorgiicola]